MTIQTIIPISPSTVIKEREYNQEIENKIRLKDYECALSSLIEYINNQIIRPEYGNSMKVKIFFESMCSKIEIYETYLLPNLLKEIVKIYKKEGWNVEIKESLFF